MHVDMQIFIYLHCHLVPPQLPLDGLGGVQVDAELRNQLHPAEEKRRCHVTMEHNHSCTLDLVWSCPGARVQATISPSVSQKEITGPKVLMCSCLDIVDIPRYPPPDVLVVPAQLRDGPHGEAGEAAAVQQVQPLVPSHGHQPPVGPQRHLPHRPVTQTGLLCCGSEQYSNIFCTRLRSRYRSISA